MLLSIALILLVGMILAGICKTLKLPGVIGMILTGLILGPYAFNLIDGTILDMAADLRKIALIIILTRAGLSLDLKELRKVGRPAILMCFVPACFEMVGMTILAPLVLPVSYLEAALLGAVVAAVSPAVIVPKMIALKEAGYGKKNSIPQMILAGASVDDVFVLVMFTAFLGLASGNEHAGLGFGKVPVSLFTGLVLGGILGAGMAWLFQKIHMRDTIKVVMVLCVGFVLVSLESMISNQIPFSGLIAIMSMGILIQKKREVVARRLSVKFSKLWVAAEIILFVLVGASVDPHAALTAGWGALILIFGVLAFRVLGVFCSLAGSSLDSREKIFCMIAYLPKATVQAAIGGVPLSLGLSCGNIVLTVAVLAILITAPLGALLVDWTEHRLLSKEE